MTGRFALVVAALALSGTTVFGAASATRTDRSATGAGMVEDAELSVAVHAALLEKLGPVALDVGVTVESGKVQLTGRVVAADERVAAEKVAGRVPGVAWVENRLRVAPPPDPEPQQDDAAVAAPRDDQVRDALLETRVKKTLIRQLGVHSLRLAIGARQGVVNLAGAVPSPKEKQQVVEAALRVPGVESVSDDVRVDRTLRKTLQ
jgi:osmotically-inducible protein OsmY